MASKKKDTGGTAVAKQEKAGALQSAELQSMFLEDQGLGTERVQKDDLMIPFIGLVQSLSPQRDEDSPKFIEGAKEGMMFNTVTETLYPKEGVTVIPVHYEKVFNEWRPRKEGGGFIASHLTEAEAIENQERGNNGEPVNDIIDTANHFVLIQDGDGVYSWAVLSMTSTKLKVSRKWNSRLKMLKLDGPNGPFTPPSFATKWLLSAVKEANDKGSFFNFKLEPAGLVEDPNVYAQAKAFREAILGGAAQVDFNKADTAVDTPVYDEGEEDEPEF